MAHYQAFFCVLFNRIVAFIQINMKISIKANSIFNDMFLGLCGVYIICGFRGSNTFNQTIHNHEIQVESEVIPHLVLKSLLCTIIYSKKIYIVNIALKNQKSHFWVLILSVFICVTNQVFLNILMFGMLKALVDEVARLKKNCMSMFGRP